MSNIGTISVAVSADTNKFAQGMGRARKELSLTEKSVNRFRGMMAGFATTFAAGFSINSLRNTLRDMDNIADAAERMGTSVKGLSRLTGGAGLLGISNSTFISAFDRMEKSVGAGSKAIEDIGLSAYQLKQLSADKMFIEIAEAIKNMPTPAERTAAALSIFGRGAGADLLEFINKGKDGITGLADEAERLGLAFDEIAARKAENAERAIARLGAVGRGAMQDAAIFAAGLTKDPANAKDFRGVVGSLTQEQFTKAYRAMSVATQLGGGIKDGNWSGDWRNGSFQTYFAQRQRIMADAGFQVSDPRGIESLDSALRERWGSESAAARAARRPKGSKAESPATGFLGINSINVMADAFARGLEQFRKTSISLPDQHRFESSIAGMDIAGNAPERRRRRGMGGGGVVSSAALEQGTAAAFSQEKRSSQQNQLLDINKRQLKQSEEQTKALRSIDTNLRQSALSMEAANLV